MRVQSVMPGLKEGNNLDKLKKTEITWTLFIHRRDNLDIELKRHRA